MTARLTIYFEDGSREEIILEKAIIINTPEETSRKSIYFGETKNGWIMNFTASLMKGRKLAKDFLTVSKE